MKVYLETIGCRLNESEIEAMARRFVADGHQIVADAADAQMHVLNTCAVTQDATRASRQRIRQLNRAQPEAKIIVTGCYSELSRAEVGALPGVTQIVSNTDKDRLVPLVLHDSGSAIEPPSPMDAEPLALDYRPGALQALGHTRAFVKVQDGCDNRCTFCVTRIARGDGRSRLLAEVVAEVQALAEAGYHEAVLSGVQLGSYSERPGGLRELVQTVLADTDMPRVRLSSLEPWDLDEAFFALWANPRLLPHLHLPLQSGSDATLKRMLRRTSQSEYRALVAMARAAIPDLALSTDIICGFPGETTTDFAESAAYIAEIDFMKLHVFPYSARPDTAAARLPNRVDVAVSKARVEQLRELSAAGDRRYRERWQGQPESVLWENVIGATPDGWINTGLTTHYVRAYWIGPRVLTNQVTAVQLGTLDRDGLTAQLLETVQHDL
jgi:threonylcarbamoyladenosine tRNA methylthiotransferase MtaB